jgi:elongation factor 2 kinase
VQDVALQMDAKLWGEEFNRHNPPKKVDIFMMAVMELVDRPGRPLYHVEHYIGLLYTLHIFVSQSCCC